MVGIQSSQDILSSSKRMLENYFANFFIPTCRDVIIGKLQLSCYLSLLEDDSQKDVLCIFIV